MIDAEVVARVARQLESVGAEPVFIGGAVVAVYLDAFARSQIRPTQARNTTAAARPSPAASS